MRVSQKKSIFRSLLLGFLPIGLILITENILGITEGDIGAITVGLIHLTWCLFFIYLFYKFFKIPVMFERIVYQVSIFM